MIHTNEAEIVFGTHISRASRKEPMKIRSSLEAARASRRIINLAQGQGFISLF